MKVGDRWRVSKNKAVLEVVEITDDVFKSVKCKVVDIGDRGLGSLWETGNIHDLTNEWFERYRCEQIKNKALDFTSLYQKLL